MRLYIEVPLVLVMCALGLLGVYFVFHAANIPETAVKTILISTAIITAVSVGIGYYIRFQRWRSSAGGQGLNQRKGSRIVVYVSMISCVIFFLSLWGLYLIVRQRYWEEGTGLLLPCGVSSLFLLKRLAMARR